MSVRPKGSGFMADFMVAGKRYREFGFKTEQEAGAWELEARAALMKGKPLPPANPEKPKAASSATISDMIRHCARVHWSSMKASGTMIKCAELFGRFHGDDTPVAECLTTSGLSEYVEDRQEAGRSGGTINRHLSAIRVVARYAVALGHLPAVPLFPWQREGEGRLRWFSPEEEAEIAGTLRLWSQHDIAFFCEFLVDTGARRGEALKLDWDCFSKGFRTVTFWETKAGNHRTIPLTSRLREGIEALKKRRGSKHGPFSDITPTELRGIWERLRTHHEFIGDAVYHTFRHTCASRLVQRGVELFHVKTWMGHKAIETTMRYSHLSPKHLEKLAEVLEQPQDKAA